MLDSVIFLALFVGLPYLTYRLAKQRKSPWLGLVVTAVFFGLSVYSAWMMNRFLHTIPEAVDLFIEQMTFLTFAFANIPTAITFVIFLWGRWRRRRKKQLEAMRLQELE